jgi:hypothetical protein
MLKTKQVPMKTIKSIIILLLFSCVFYAQRINVKIKLEWQKEKNPFGMDKMPKMDSINIPYLLISYSNTDTLNYYFRKLTYDKDKCPRVESDFHEGVLYHSIDSMFYSFQKFKGSVSVISFVFNDNFFLTGWKMQHDATISRDWVELLSDLKDFNDIVELQNYLNKEKKYQLVLYDYPKREYISYDKAFRQEYNKERKPYISSTNLPWEMTGINAKDITPEGISVTLSKIFLFLKAGETYTDRIALTPFYLAGGTYEFCFPSSNFPPDVMCTSWEMKENQRVDLPKEVNGYRLYIGEIKADTVVLSVK